MVAILIAGMLFVFGLGALVIGIVVKDGYHDTFKREEDE